MDYVEVELNGTSWRMPVNYTAYLKIAKQVVDPLQAVQNAKAALAAWTGEDVINIIYTGVATAGSGLSRDQVAGAMVKAGLLNFIDVAANYVVALSAGDEASAADNEKKADTQA